MRLSQQTAFPDSRALCLLSAIGLLCAGCSQAWFNSFLDPTQIGNFRSHEIVEIQRSISFYDPPMGVPGAEEPKPEDLVAIVEEYRIGPGDVLSIRLLDFVAIGAETDLTPVTVNELGEVFIPQLGKVPAEGRTAYELQEAIIARAKEREIYSQEDQPTVVVTVTSAQQRVFYLAGAIAQPGMYPIIRPDFRLREALNLGGGLDQSVKDIYIVRNQPREKIRREPTMESTPPGTPATRPDEFTTPPPVSPVSLAEMGQAQGPAAATGHNGSNQPTTHLAVPPEQAERELMEALAPEAEKNATRGQSQTPSPASPSATQPSRPRWIYVNDTFIEAPATEAATTEPTAAEPALPTPAAPEAAPPATTQPVDWEELAQEGQQRIIHIPAEQLRSGAANYNIVIRHDDWIRLDPGPTGAFYLSGHVVRPGAYNFVGEQITLRQAIASAGGLDGLAWPTRCSITRRIQGDREEILQLDLARIAEGKDPDFYLKPNDLIDVGTHAIAPLLLTIRNSFRLTYGFGFVYDRNFADIDAYIPQQNPRDVRRVTLQQRFPGLFP